MPQENQEIESHDLNDASSAKTLEEDISLTEKKDFGSMISKIKTK